MKRQLSLDTIISAITLHLRKWSPELKGNQAGDILRYLICRLYEEGNGDLIHAHLKLAQVTVSMKLGLTRYWVGILCKRLKNAGWINYSSSAVSSGMNSSTIFTIGPQFMRLIIMLQKSKKRKFAFKKKRYNDSVIEKIFAEAISGEIEGVVPQLSVGEFYVDFAIPRIKLAIELDGYEFHSSLSQRAYDIRRTRFLQENGWTVVRFTGTEIKSAPAACVNQVMNIAKEICRVAA